MKIDNIAVEVLNIEHGKEVVKAFKELGVDTRDVTGVRNLKDRDTSWHYGIINGDFRCFYLDEIIDTKIITLEQLKSMKEDKSEYPKLMWVSDNNYNRCKRTVIGFFNNSYWALNNHNNTTATRWKYAQDIEETPDPKQEEKTKVEFTGALCMGDFQKKTMTFEIEGDMTLQAGRYLISKIN